jgi:serine/threonine protein phosphatase PrpC
MQEELQLEVWQLTDPGLERGYNEDRCGSFEPEDPELLDQRGRLYVVADGMGGHQAGDVAAQYAVEQVLHLYYHDPWVSVNKNLVQAIQSASAYLYREARANPARRGMGTTMVAAVIQRDELTVANVGDSRAYLVGGGQMRQISRDHSWVAERLAEGLLTPEQARTHPNRNIITRSVGNDAHVEVDLFHERIVEGQVVLLCTDGLSGVVEDEEMAAVLSWADPRSAAEELVRIANERGGPDNITVTVIKVPGPSPPQQGDHPTPLRMPKVAEPAHRRWWHRWLRHPPQR